MSLKPNHRHNKYKLVAPKRTAAITRGLARLDTYTSTNVAAQTLINTIKTQCETRDIRNIQTALSAAHSLTHNNFNEFGKTFEAMSNRKQER